MGYSDDKQDLYTHFCISTTRLIYLDFLYNLAQFHLTNLKILLTEWASIIPTSWNLLFAAIMFCTYICYWQFPSTQYISQYIESTSIKVSFYVNTQRSYNLGMVTNQSAPSYFASITKHSLDYFYVMCQQDIIAKSAHNDIFHLIHNLIFMQFLYLSLKIICKFYRQT